MERWIGHPPGRTGAVQPSESTDAHAAKPWQRTVGGCCPLHSRGMTTNTSAGSDFPLGPDGLPDLPLRVLEDDENVPPRPEEELADLERTDPQAP